MADKLVETGWAYPCFCTEEELIAKREQVIEMFCVTVVLRSCSTVLGGLTPARCCSAPHGVPTSRFAHSR